MGKRKTNEEFQDDLKKLQEEGHDVYTDDEYVDNKTDMWFYCSKGHRWLTKPKIILRGYGCPYYSGLKVIVGETSLWDTRPDIASLLLDPQDGYRYSAGSGKVVKFMCPICNTVHDKKICTVCRYGFSCSVCSDGISYPEKFMRSLLTQLKIDFKCQVSRSIPGFEWISNSYRYDFYVEYNNMGFFIETDGGFHRTQDAKNKDKIKDEMAKNHNIRMIRIDCDYPDVLTRFQYIKDHIIHSDLSNIFNLSCIDWNLCNECAQNKMVVEAAILYNTGLTISEIKNRLGYHRTTIRKWLKQATQIGLCNYSVHDSKVRSRKITTALNVPVNQYSLDNIYIKTYASMAEASNYLSIPSTSLARACDSKNHIINECRLYRASDLNQPDKSKIILTIQN